MIKKITFPIIVICLTYGCKPIETVTLPEQTIELSGPTETIKERPIYQASYTKTFDLIHTQLAVKFDWEKAHLHGKAVLTLKPHFYATDQLILDARGFDIHKIAMLNDNKSIALNYDYDKENITIDLAKEYQRNDTLTIAIDYTAKPNELEEGGSAAISSDKGLYFINHKGEEKDKPQQIWTQGETEANSAWFPTIDAPNQKTTQEIAITVEEKYRTLSNGVLTHSEVNGDGTRTDFWEMNLPHAPYLAMMAIGEYKVVEDKWKNIPVNYYVEPEYEAYAKDIFGLTPEMMTFFSKQLGVDYPWQKYSQVIVRDFVSGAMENTTAVIHGDFVYQTKREMIDGSSGEDVIAHELFHHWFGDLVTCESWANLPLNESFATYGEFLWNEYKYGDDKAAQGLQNDLSTYLQQGRQDQNDMIRFDYEHREDMFDTHSYQKGGRILHMLRNYIGDEAFFTSLKLYLENNKYTDVEMHQLRIACEKVTGEDLNWFFNQWFYASGHPILAINYEYIDSTKTQIVKVEQTQNFEENPLYRLPLHIDLYVNGQKETKKVVINQAIDTFSFQVSQQPDLVNFDADKMLLCEKTDHHNAKEWAYLYYNGPRYLDRYEAIQKLKKSDQEKDINVIIAALSDPYYGIRRDAIQAIKNPVKTQPEKVKNKLLDLAKNDRNSLVRGDAIVALARYFDDDDIKTVYINGLTEKSYYVIGRSLNALAKVDSEEAMKQAKKFENDENASIVNAVSDIYTDYGTADQLDYFMQMAKKVNGYDKYSFTMSYGDYLSNQDHATVRKGIPVLEDIAVNEKAWWMRLMGINSLTNLETTYEDKVYDAEEQLKELQAGNEDKEKEMALQTTIKQNKALRDDLAGIIKEIKENEKNPRIQKMFDLTNTDPLD